MSVLLHFCISSEQRPATDYSISQCAGFPIEDSIFNFISLKITQRVGARVLKAEDDSLGNQVFLLLGQKTFYKRPVLAAPHCSSFLQLRWQLSGLWVEKLYAPVPRWLSMWFHVLFSSLPTFRAITAGKFGAVIVWCRERLEGEEIGLTPTLCLNVCSLCHPDYAWAHSSPSDACSLLVVGISDLMECLKAQKLKNV